ncbi:MAG: hypothetical protein CVU62_01325 [Deltaproteobacteria bacterium HGW-Deltaproteobacteria-2]|jgi:hypothetical protein|nr:MAG: hypothetical protein CVU62_01325 [Deltaproteobacteria bacterium HGW-Deltaproteobacteria-2]
MKCIGSIIGVVIFLCSLSGCFHFARPTSVAKIEPNPDWHIEEKCGYEGCAKIVDFLVGKDVTVRVEAQNDYVRDNIFTIKVAFETSEKSTYIYTPSANILTLPNGKTVSSKDFPCRYTIYSLATFESYNNLKERAPLKDPPYKGKRGDCFILYFNVQPPPPSVEENFTLDIGSLEKDGKLIKIPRIHFSKGMRR